MIRKLVEFIRSNVPHINTPTAQGSRIFLWVPYVWLVLFLIFPFLILFKVSLSEYIFGMPPYGPVIQWVDGTYLNIKLFFSNYFFFFKDSLYLRVYFDSILTAFIASACALMIAYPFAYAIYSSPKRIRTLLILLIVLPFYTSFLLRVYAWIGLLNNQGIINYVLMALGIIQTPLKILYTKFAVIIGIVYCYLPFMIIPIYLSLEKMDKSYLEAAYDLGAKPLKTFFTITVPMTKQGIIAGFVLVFIPAIGEFVIPEILGGAKNLMIGRIVWNEFFNNRDWPFSATIAILMFLFVVFPLTYLQNREDKGANHE